MEKKVGVANDRTYDEFDPIARWTSEPGFETLTVYLPGFRKEQLKVQVTTTRKLRVMGERPAGGNKWIRFWKEFPIQANLDVDAISAKFEDVNLVVKLPKPEPKGKQSPSSDGDAKPPVHQAGLKPSVQELPKPAEKNEKVQERPEPAIESQNVKESPMEEPGRKEETSTGAEKVHPPKPATEKRSEKEEASSDTGKIKEKDEVKGPPCRKVGGYKNVVSGYLREMRNNKRAMSAGLVVIASMVVFSLGIYAGKRL
ncbi:PREDICTED: inactive protein RESTRICTED TEV MOVEMENT 2-like [Tarenaya hassleriana]|uniref:inactive protein RESTRICTED TEV MOVEMENT 2-like n=1 Tax=Tarenaya hassleriana TaxID=28532 RepID=UPI00053C7438|nr:PREDICTED: inactive protein RESTRICTED TEV MOVEMENT 2-like [Tarenaya hassleriana]